MHYSTVQTSSHTNGGRAPVLFVPSLINAPDVLDLSPRHSLLRFLSNMGHDIYQVDWGCPDRTEADVDIAGHVSTLLLPLIARLPRPPLLVGYCLGGTIAIAAAGLTATAGLVTLAAPWNFDAYPDSFRDNSHAAWTAAEPLCRDLGLLPMEILQHGFWELNPRRTVHKYADFLDLEEHSESYEAFLKVEDWANEGAPLTYGAGRELIEQFYGNNVTGDGNWMVNGQAIDPAALPCPTFAISSTTDRIVPHGARPEMADALALDLGHVGMIVSRTAPDRLWRPLSDWLTIHGG